MHKHGLHLKNSNTYLAYIVAALATLPAGEHLLAVPGVGDEAQEEESGEEEEIGECHKHNNVPA